MKEKRDTWLRREWERNKEMLAAQISVACAVPFLLLMMYLPNRALFPDRGDDFLTIALMCVLPQAWFVLELAMDARDVSDPEASSIRSTWLVLRGICGALLWTITVSVSIFAGNYVGQELSFNKEHCLLYTAVWCGISLVTVLVARIGK